MHKTTGFNRSPILSWFDLTEEQKDEFPAYEDGNDQYVIFKYNDGEQALPLSMFERYDSILRPNKNYLWSGIYPTSYSDAFFIRISACGSEALVCRRYFV